MFVGLGEWESGSFWDWGLFDFLFHILIHSQDMKFFYFFSCQVPTTQVQEERLYWQWKAAELQQANISYTFQTILTFSFGALTSLWVLYLNFSNRKTAKEHKDDGTEPPKPHPSLLELQTIFLHLTAQFTLPIAIAALVRLKQKAPFFEISFMNSLLLTQLLGLFSTAVAWFPHEPKTKPRIIVGVYLSLDFALVATFIGMSFMSWEDWNPVSDLAKACRQYESIGPGFSYLPIKRDWEDWFFEYVAPWWGIAYLVAIMAIVMGILLLIFIGFSIWEWRGMPWFLAAVSSVFGAGAIACFVKLEIKRYAMRWVTGKEYVDDEWGFGQILAVCLWVPLVVQMGYYVGREGEKRLQLRFGMFSFLRCPWEGLANEDCRTSDTSGLENQDNSPYQGFF